MWIWVFFAIPLLGKVFLLSSVCVASMHVVCAILCRVFVTVITVWGCTTICRVFVRHHCRRKYHYISSVCVASLYEVVPLYVRVFVWQHCLRGYKILLSNVHVKIKVGGNTTICRVFVWHHCRRLYACVIRYLLHQWLRPVPLMLTFNGYTVSDFIKRFIKQKME